MNSGRLNRRRKKDSVEPLCTLEEIAAELGVTRQRVGQIEIKALAKVRRGLMAAGVSAEALFRTDALRW